MKGARLPATVLCVIDEAGCRNFRLPLPSNGATDRVVLCFLTTDFELARSVETEVRGATGAKVEVIDFATRFNDKAFALRQGVLEFVGGVGDWEIAGTSLKSYFKVPFRGFSAWWLSALAEKNTLGSPSFHLLVQLMTLLDLLEEYGCNTVAWATREAALEAAVEGYCSENDVRFVPLLRRRWSTRTLQWPLAVSYAKAAVLAAMFLLRSAAIRVAMRDGAEPSRKTEDAKYLFVTYFPHVVGRELSGQRFVSRFFEPLQRAIESEHGRDAISWLSILIDIDGYNWRSGTRLARQIKDWGYRIHLWEQGLSVRQVGASVAAFFVLSARFLRARRLLEKRFRFPERNVNIWPIFRGEWYSSFAGFVLLRSLLDYELCAAHLRSIPSSTTVCYIAENYRWERALTIAARENGHSRIIGIQHTMVPLLLLNYFNDRRELGGNDPVQSLPRPDYLACVGRIPADNFVDSGWERDRIAVLGGIRFQHFRSYLEQDVRWKDREKAAVVAFPLMRQTTREILRYVYQSFSSNPGYTVYLKAHPSCPLEPILQELGLKLPVGIFKQTETPLGELFGRARVAIVPGSSAALEAFACGCPVVAPQLTQFVDLNPLSGVTDLVVRARNTEDLRGRVDAIVSGARSPAAPSRYRSVVSSYIELHAEDSIYLERLERLEQIEQIEAN